MFDELVSEKLIEWIWVLASIGVVINGIVLMIAGGGGWNLLMALIFVAIGLLVVRVFCESMIVIFKIHDHLEQSTFALGEIQRYQPQIVSNLMAQTAVPVVSTSPDHVAGWTTASARPQTGVIKESQSEQKAIVRQEQKDQAQSNQAVLKSRLREWPGGTSSSS